MSKKIESLTPEQEARMPFYRDKWLKLGLTTKRVTQERAEEIIHPLQTDILGRKASPVYLVEDPIAAWNKVCDLVPGSDRNAPIVWPWLCGSYDAGLFAYYDFWLSENIVEVDDEVRRKFRIWEQTCELGLIYALEDNCVICQPPSVIERNERGLHCETGKALAYGDWGFYSLNGVVVPEYLVMTPSEDLELDWYTKQDNADIKAEFVRKFGVERMLSFGKQVDSYKDYANDWWTKSEYELWDMTVLFPGLEYQPYLKMLNQTTGIWHVEAVSPACRSLPEALKERFGGRDFEIAAIS